MKEQKLIEVKNLKISFPNNGSNIQVVRGIDYTINQGEILGILGESGSGKTVSATAMIGLTEYDGGKIDDGEIIYDGADLTKLPEKELRKIRGREISYIFQNPVDTLNPYRKIGKQLEEVQKVHKDKVSKKNIIGLLLDLGLENPEMIYNMYPKQLSGGQCQRISIAMSLIGKSKIIIADEPTSSIDASMQGMALELLRTVNSKYGVTLVVITHNLEVVKNLCNSVMVMYGGLIMEKGQVEDVLDNPVHPYTRELMNCANSMNKNDRILYTLDGKTPNPQELKDECPFYSRCKSKSEACLDGIPKLRSIDNGRVIRCIIA
jgi:oligopeptide/dipeptide ABC transporter ATP-binding protein